MKKLVSVKRVIDYIIWKAMDEDTTRQVDAVVRLAVAKSVSLGINFVTIKNYEN